VILGRASQEVMRRKIPAEVMPGGSSGEVRLLRRREKNQSAAQASQKARIVAASEGFAFASTTSREKNR